MSVVTREWGVLGSAEDRDGAGASSSLTVGLRRREGSRVVHGPWPDDEAGDIEYEPVVRLDRRELAAALTGLMQMSQTDPLARWTRSSCRGQLPWGRQDPGAGNCCSGTS